MTTAFVQTVPTPDGAFTIIADEPGRVLASGWSADVERVRARIPVSHRPDALKAGKVAAALAVERYYAGDLDAVHGIEVHQPGTPLQQTGWDALRRIRPGVPLSYTEFAGAIGRPAAVRAAAAICARNAPALFVPCHRVLRTDGSLGGFAWGLEVKRRLLDREAAAWAP